MQILRADKDGRSQRIIRIKIEIFKMLWVRRGLVVSTSTAKDNKDFTAQAALSGVWARQTTEVTDVERPVSVALHIEQENNGNTNIRT